MKYDKAYELCWRQHSVLAYIEDSAEDEYIKREFGNQTYWIGINCQKDRWLMTNSELAFHTNWIHRQAKGCPLNEKAVYETDYPGGWNITDKNSSHYYACKHKIVWISATLAILLSTAIFLLVLRLCLKEDDTETIMPKVIAGTAAHTCRAPVPDVTAPTTMIPTTASAHTITPASTSLSLITATTTIPTNATTSSISTTTMTTIPTTLDPNQSTSLVISLTSLSHSESSTSDTVSTTFASSELSTESSTIS
ncbi:unnamed protein product [Enterobius vermicularis]|uniref:C-type lectin domain-containing protein n=1 Tax=Enterobius vermicularis TaxID=51028 RepID=A0A0N4V0T6_ENTVE|nr:unnamed protein product [Enterobius vermicularis]